MKILVVDPNPVAGQSISMRVALDGHEVVYSPILGDEGENPYLGFIGQGVKGVKTDPDGWMRWIDWADAATVIGSSHRGHIVDYLRRQGVPTSGPGRKEVEIEVDREVGAQLAKEAGIALPWQKVFMDSQAVEAYIKKNPGRYVLKFDQTVRGATETRVGEDPKGKDLIRIIQDLDGSIPFAKGEFKIYLQEFLEGYEISVAGWFNGKKIMGDELMLCYEGTGFGFVYDLRDEAISLIDQIVDREAISQVLRKINFRGHFDINGRLVGKKFYLLEWTPRWGGGITGFFCHAAEDLGKLIYAAGSGKDMRVLKKSCWGNINLVISGLDGNPNDPQKIKDVILPPGESPPIIRKNASFWVEPLTRSRGDGRWVVLYDTYSPYNTYGCYVVTAPTLSVAFGMVEDLIKEARVVGAVVELAKERADLQKRVKAIPVVSQKEEWISDIARTMNHVYQSPFRTRS